MLSTAVLIGALRVNNHYNFFQTDLRNNVLHDTLKKESITCASWYRICHCYNKTRKVSLKNDSMHLSPERKHVETMHLMPIIDLFWLIDCSVERLTILNNARDFLEFTGSLKWTHMIANTDLLG